MTSSMTHDKEGKDTAWGDRRHPGPLACNIVDSSHTHSHIGYEVVGISQGSKVWTNGDVEFADSGYNYNVMVLGFR